MPPLGPRHERLPRTPIEAEKGRQAERRNREQDIYGRMWALITAQEKNRSRFLASFTGRHPSTKKASYELPDEPAFRKMTAWVTTFWGTPQLRTQLIEEVDGRIIRKEKEEKRAVAVGGELRYTEVNSWTHDEKLQRLTDIAITLSLIEEQNQSPRI